MTQEPIIIIGAGLSGLVLAHGLKKYQIPYKIYDRDQDIHSRNQESSLTLHQSWNQLTEIFTYEQLLSLIETSSVNPDDMNISLVLVDGRTNQVLETMETKGPNKHTKEDLADLHSESVMQKKPLFTAYRLNHHRLRQWLAKDLDIHWGYELDHITTTNTTNTTNTTTTDIENNHHDHLIHVQFKNGHSVQGKLLVGADGTRSKVCEHIVGGKDIFNQITGHHPSRMFVCKRWLTEDEYSEFQKIIPFQGAVFGFPKEEDDDDANDKLEDNKYPDYPIHLLTFVLTDVKKKASPDAPYQITWLINKYEEDIAILTKEDRNMTDYQRLQLCKSWVKHRFHGAIRSTVFDTPDDAVVSKVNLWERTVPMNYLSKHPSITLIGDAMHSMVPAKGSGGNQGVIDAVFLANQLKNVYQPTSALSLTEALLHYHQDADARTRDLVKSSSELLTSNLQSPDQFVGFMRHIKQMVLTQPKN
ncbi:unnamed protein product [Cunninghamella blakesleeana]